MALPTPSRMQLPDRALEGAVRPANDSDASPGLAQLIALARQELTGDAPRRAAGSQREIGRAFERASRRRRDRPMWLRIFALVLSPLWARLPKALR